MPLSTRMIRWLGVFCVFLSFSSSSLAQNFSYTQSFENSNPFKFWSSNGSYDINYFGPSGDHAASGDKSLKMDITVKGSGSKECYYYWILPVYTNLIGSMKLTAKLWMNSETAQYVSLGYHYSFPPTGIERTPLPPKVTDYNTWYNYEVDLAQDVIYHADYFAKNNIYGSTFDDFGRELTFLQLVIRVKGTKRLIFYLDNIQVKGTVLSQSAYTSNYLSAWSSFKKRLNSAVYKRQTEYNNLPAIPKTSGKSLSSKAKDYVQTLNECKTNISSTLKQMAGKTYFAPEIMDACENHLSMYPSYWNLLKTELSTPDAKLALFSMDATKYSRITGSNIPGNLQSAAKLSARMCAGEYEPFTLFLLAQSTLNDITVTSTALSGNSGSIPSSAVDISIAKVWYQKGYQIQGYDDKWLTQELLIKNDNLIRVDEGDKTNSILVQKSDGRKDYVVISNPNSSIPRNVKIKDSDVLLPFSIPSNRSKLLWITIHVPDNASPGKYTGKITLRSDQGFLASVPLEIQVLPFQLEQSILDYAIYYHGFVNDWSWEEEPFSSFGKNSRQYEIEMRDLKEHGVDYPTTYQTINGIQFDLAIRNKVGLPKDKLYSAGITTDNPTTESGINNLKSQINALKNKMDNYGYRNLYVYGIDEAVGTTLMNERKSWEAVHQTGAKVFASGYYSHYNAVGDLLDVAVIQNSPRLEQAKLYHSQGNKIYNYRNPMVGVEDPEIYRRNYGLLLWKEGYDGTMNYAYQREFKDIWNDFDIEPNQPHPYRDHCFTYPVSDGIIGTVQWEGFREAVDDVRYLSTLLKKMNILKSRGVNVSSLQQFVNSIDPSADPAQNREDIIDRILGILGSAPGKENPDPTQVTSTDHPDKFELSQNYPNPFNPSTRIKYALPMNTLVNIKVYDILGKEVLTLVNEQQDAGYYEVNFDGVNLPSGVYIYNINTKDFVQSKKMLLIK